MTMADWKEKMDAFLQFTDAGVLTNAGKIIRGEYNEQRRNKRNINSVCRKILHKEHDSVWISCRWV